MKTSIFWLFLAGVLIVTAGCDIQNPFAQLAEAKEKAARQVKLLASQQDQCPTVSDNAPKRIVFFVIDVSGSFANRFRGSGNSVSKDIKNMVRSFPPSTLVLVHLITSDSYTDKVKLVDFIPPALPGVDCRKTNPLDPRERARCFRKKLIQTARTACISAARVRIINSIMAIKPMRSRNTDIRGALATINDVFDSYKVPLKKSVIFYSDMIDNVHRELPDAMPGFEGAKVTLRLSPTSTPRAMVANLATYRELLENKHRAEIRVTSLAAPLPVKSIF